MGKDLAVLIPAYNEEPRLGTVLDVVCAYHRKPRILVIDDGSRDSTRAVAEQYPVETIGFAENKGKGAALQAGLEHMGDADYYLFLDADLIGLHHGHMDALVTPLEDDPNTGMTVGVFRGGRNITDLAHKYFGILNGQRALSRDFVQRLPDRSWSRFGVEILMSKFAEKQGIPVANPWLQGLTHYTKEDKFGFSRGFPYRLQMYNECLYSLFNWQKHA